MSKPVTTPSAHTAGPWTVHDQGSRLAIRFGETDDTLAYVPTTDMGMPQEEIEANARLIAAAPELLEELKSVLRYKDTCGCCDGSGEPQTSADNINGRCENCGGMGYVVLPSMACDFSFIEKLIAKAEGN